MNTYTKQKKPRIYGIVTVMVLCVALYIYAGYGKKMSAATTPDEQYIGYVSISIEENDTLSGIASKYYSREFGSLQDYMTEIRNCNSLNNDTIYIGNHLIIPVYDASSLN